MEAHSEIITRETLTNQPNTIKGVAIPFESLIMIRRVIRIVRTFAHSNNDVK